MNGSQHYGGSKYSKRFKEVRVDITLYPPRSTVLLGDLAMLTFNEYVLENATILRPPTPTSVPVPVMDSMRSAGLIPTSLPEFPSVAEVAAVLASRIEEMHRLVVAGPSTINEKRISYQNLNACFLSVLGLAGSFPEDTEERQ
jgi:hypothetical protein